MPHPGPLEGARMVAVAKAIATRAHAGQTDKAGEPYIGHPARIAALFYDPDTQAVAWLHDVLEDTDTTADDLLTAGIPDRVVTAVEALTKQPGEPLEVSIGRAGANPLAARVKRGDVADNTDPHRVAQLDEATRDRLEKKYARTLALLDDAEQKRRQDTP